MLNILGDALGGVLKPITGIINKRVEDRDLRNKLLHDLRSAELKGELQLVLAQVQLNAAEAKHRSVFVAGWRPFVGWVCGLGMAINFVVIPVASPWVQIVPTDMATMMPVLLGMLGLGGLRTFEKVKGAAK